MRIISLTLILSAVIFLNSETYADTKRDCSQYSTKTLSGLSDKMRCKKGLPPLKKNFLKSLEWKKNKSKSSYDPSKPCDEYSSKTFVGLVNKMKCKREK